MNGGDVGRGMAEEVRMAVKLEGGAEDLKGKKVNLAIQGGVLKQEATQAEG